MKYHRRFLSVTGLVFLACSRFSSAGEFGAFNELYGSAGSAVTAAASTGFSPVREADFSGGPVYAYEERKGAPAARESAIAFTAERAERLAAMAGAGLTLVSSTNGGTDGQDKYFYWGVPSKVSRVSPAQVGVMRHWTSNAQVAGVPVVDLIVQSGLLKAGPRAYIIPLAHRIDYFYDLHGVFFTTPDFDQELLWMGLKADSDYVDFVVDPGMGALYLAPGNYLFPCPLNTPKWIRGEYLKWKETGVLPSGMKATFDNIDRDGGLYDTIDVPVTVVSYQKNGKVTVLRPDLLEKPYN